jgi:hypothetical protein
MAITLYTFNILTDTGANYQEDSLPANGALLQARFVLADTGALDTGADLKISFPTTGVVAADWDNFAAASFTKVPQQPVHDTGGAAVSGLRQFPFVAEEPIRVRVDAGGVAKRGTLYLLVG